VRICWPNLSRRKIGIASGPEMTDSRKETPIVSIIRLKSILPASTIANCQHVHDLFHPHSARSFDKNEIRGRKTLQGPVGQFLLVLKGADMALRKTALCRLCRMFGQLAISQYVIQFARIDLFPEFTMEFDFSF